MRRAVFRSTVIRAALVAGFSLAAFIEQAHAQNLFEFLFGGGPKPAQQQPQRGAPPSDNPVANFFADPFGVREQQQQQPQRNSIGGGRGGAGFCVRTCDGKYFPLLRSAASPEQMCQAYCPASSTRVYYGGAIDDAATASGERYADSDNAFAFRKALKADCTCNGRSPAGLAQIDLSLDSSLRAGDVIATGNGLVAYSGNRTGGSQDFTPVASYPGLTSEVRARLGEMKVSPNDQPSVAPPPAPEAAPPARAPANARMKRAVVETGTQTR